MTQRDDYAPAKPSGLSRAEELVWDRVLSVKTIHRNRADTLARYCKASVDEDVARAEMQSAIASGDANMAKTFAGIARDMRNQALKIFESF